MCRASIVSLSLDGQIYSVSFDSDSKRKHVSDDNTYILALDGDTDFHPSAVILLVDRLRMYGNVGAACGRIHPTGMGENWVFLAKTCLLAIQDVSTCQVVMKAHL